MKLDRTQGRADRWRCASIVVAVLVLAFSGSAAAQNPGDGGVDQYTETVPTGQGGEAPTVTPETTNPLPPSVESEIEEAGADAAHLKRIATSSRFGAPRSLGTRESEIREAGSASPAPSSSTFSAGVSAVADDGDGLRLAGLLLAMLLSGAIALFAGVRRHRRRGARQAR